MRMPVNRMVSSRHKSDGSEVLKRIFSSDVPAHSHMPCAVQPCFVRACTGLLVHMQINLVAPQERKGAEAGKTWNPHSKTKVVRSRRDECVEQLDLHSHLRSLLRARVATVDVG